MRAKFHSQDHDYRAPVGAVTLGTNMRFHLILESGSKSYCMFRYRLSTSPEKERFIPMEKVREEQENIVFECRFLAPMNPCLVWYDFLIREEETYWYLSNNEDCLGGEGILKRESGDPFQITVYREMAEETNWLEEGVMYQIFVDRFFSGTPAGTYQRPVLMHTDWYDSPYYVKDEQGRILRYDFFGGNLNGIKEKLDYLQELGVTILYLNPIFESASNHKYDTADYLKIDPNFGSEQDLANLCAEATTRGISIILDGVFSHLGSDSRYFNREGFYNTLGAYQSKESPYYSWFRFRHYPDDYESWWGIDTMPNVDEEDQSYQSFVLDAENGVLTHWMNKGICGWRLDVADELPDSFIKGIQHRVKKTNAQGVVIGEVWEDASNKVSYEKQREYLFGDELDSVMNYPYREGILRFLRREETGIQFMRTILSLQENYPPRIFYQLMNFLGTHDTMRVINAMIYKEEPQSNKSELMKKQLTGEERRLALKRLNLAVMLLFTLPGTPCIYYGDEAGIEGWKDPFNRCTYPWGREDQETMSLYKAWSRYYHEYPALRKGTFISCEAGEESMIFIRRLDSQIMICAVNAGTAPVEIHFPDSGEWSSITTKQSHMHVFTLEGESGDVFVKSVR